MENQQDLIDLFDELDEKLTDLTAEARAGASLADVLRQGQALVARMLSGFAITRGKPMPASDDLLELFKGFVKGDPSLNSVRDNVRELVYYQNCLNEGREDALPVKPEMMVAHTARHIYCYLRSRAEQEKAVD